MHMELQADTDSLASVNIPLPNLIADEPEILFTSGVAPPSRRAAPCARGGPSLLTVPGAPPRHQGDSVGEELADSSQDEEPEDRPRTVLSVFRSVGRPLSALSTRARSALSNTGQHLLDIPSNVRGVLQRWIRERRRRRVAPSGVSTPDSIELRSDSGKSGRVRKQLDSLAGSEYGSDEDDNSTTAAATGRNRVTRPLRRLHRRLKRASCRPSCAYIVDPKGDTYLVWMALVFVAFLYNAITIPLRAAFGLDISNSTDPGLIGVWLTCDHIADLVYVLDLLLVQSHISSLHRGVLVRDMKIIGKQFVFRRKFWLLDVPSLLPVQLLYAIPALRYTALIRLPRLLRVYQVLVFLHLYENSTKYPHVFRLFKMCAVFLFIIHLYTCVYYVVSLSIGLGTDEWVYDGQGNSYLHCFYWAVLTAATIHDLHLRDPTNNLEYTVEMLGYLLGVFIVAIIISEISNIVGAANYHKLEFQRRRDHLKDYIRLWKTPQQLQDKMQLWFDYASAQQYMLDDNEALDSLHPKMRTDLAIHVHLDTLCRVRIFQDCEKTLLRELVYKLQPVLFVPGDYICRKGEIGKEMYIVNQGIVQVVGVAHGKEQILADLGPGNVFGEISLLAVGGGNRRTAHVISKGFSSLFVLSKRDLNRTLQDYPDAEQTLLRKAKYLLKQDRKREAESNQPPSATVLATQIRHSKAAQEAVTAFSTLATRAAHKRDPDQQEVLPTVEVHEPHSRGGLSSQEAAAASRMRHAITHQHSMPAPSQATTLSLQSAATSQLAPSSDCSQSSLWSSIRGVDGLASLIADDTNISEVSTATRSSLWPSLQHSSRKSSSLWQRLASSVDQDTMTDEVHLLNDSQH